jgi:hypothetical protein
MPVRHLVHLAADYDRAAEFARFRAQYERAANGASIQWGEARMVKVTDSRDSKALPAVIEVHLPDDWHLAIDPDQQESGMYVSRLAIPARDIAKVTPISLAPDSHSRAYVSRMVAEAKAARDRDFLRGLYA